MITQKILNIMRKVEYLAKDDKVEFGNTKYKALSEEKVTAILRKAMLEENVIVFPIEMTETRDGNITHVHVKYRLVDTEDDSSIEVVSCGDGYDTQDKGAGKAMTYAFKYMWLRTFAIPTGDDPDKVSSDEIDAMEAERKTAEIAVKKISETKVNSLVTKANEDRVSIEKLCKLYHVTTLSELTEAQLSKIVNTWTSEVVKTCGA